MKVIKIPEDRVGALIGREGATKRRIEDRTGAKLDIDSEGEVIITEEDYEDPLMQLKVVDLIKAIGRGFSPHRALRILEDDEYLDIIDIRDFVGRKSNHVRKMRGRVIGSDGKTRSLIEELTGAYVSVYGSTVSIIANSIQMPVARKAVTMILSGSEHSTVYSYLERSREDLRMAELGFE